MRVIHPGAALAATLVTLGCSSFLGESGSQGNQSQLNCSIPESQLFNGGPGRDGIPALTTPEFGTQAQSGFSDNTRVLGLVINDEARAYPLPIFWWHEVINDRLGGDNVLISYCPLTASGLAFDPTVQGELRNFGVSGLLFENNLVMFDRTNESLWNQLLLGAQCGPDRGASLARLPITETTLGRWMALHPQSTVVTQNTGFDRQYSVYPYGDYAVLSNAETLFPSSGWSNERPPKEPVLGVREAGRNKAYPFGELSDLGDAVAVNDDFAGRAVLITYEGSSSTAVAFDRTIDSQVLTFSVVDSTDFILVDSETGSEWNALGQAIAGPLQGSELEPVSDSYQLFWFAWSVYHPDTEIFQQ
jgi:hypothetical protein